MSDDWLFGRGILSDSTVVTPAMTFDHAHNLYLSITEQGGLVALALYLVVLLKTILILFKNYEESDAKFGLAVLILGLAAQLLDLEHLVDKVGIPWFIIWLPIAIALGIQWRNTQR